MWASWEDLALNGDPKPEWICGEFFSKKKEKENPKSALKKRERICDKIFHLCKKISNKNKDDWHILKEIFKNLIKLVFKLLPKYVNVSL